MKSTPGLSFSFKFDAPLLWLRSHQRTCKRKSNGLPFFHGTFTHLQAKVSIALWFNNYLSGERAASLSTQYSSELVCFFCWPWTSANPLSPPTFAGKGIHEVVTCQGSNSTTNGCHGMLATKGIKTMHANVSRYRISGVLLFGSVAFSFVEFCKEA